MIRMLAFILHALTPLMHAQVLQQTNLLMIMFDDLRPELKAYGREHMITPNFDRLAAQSVLFDNAYAQIAVCNPSRDSLLTGLRPDSTGTYAFQSSYHPHVLIPQRMVSAGYNTAGFGKTLHWETADKNYWSYDSWEGNWYDYQGAENNFMLSSVMPDKKLPEHQFRDHLFTTRTIECLKKMAKEKEYFMLNIGFKNPHLALHVPHRYYEMYKNKTDAFKLTKRELRFPYLASGGGYKCCAEGSFNYMNAEGSERSKEHLNIGDINQVIPQRMRDELMMGYCGMITYTDTQLGRILDMLDELQLWNNITIVLTADHGMHNGEKGLWEKWSLFDESSRVPLMIYHPKSPFKGKHYTSPVELIDVFPTINDLTQAPYNEKKLCKDGNECDPLQGKSLAPVVLGEVWHEHSAKSVMKNESIASIESIILPRDFSITQVWRCVDQDQYTAAKKLMVTGVKVRPKIWQECERDGPRPNEISAMGYSMRTKDYRYTAWLKMDVEKMMPMWELPPLEEDLFDHRNETLADFTHRETMNVAKRPAFEAALLLLREKLITFLKTEIKYRGKF